jgi:hypothetical protein
MAAGTALGKRASVANSSQTFLGLGNCALGSAGVDRLVAENTVSDEGLDDALITARQEREGASLRAFEEGVKLQIPLTDMWFISHVARWLFTQHRARGNLRYARIGSDRMG